MPIGKALLLKGLGGFAILGSTIGGSYFTYDYLNNRATRFDRGLIDFLEAGGKIQFSVKDGNDANISNDFPTFTNGTPPQTKTATVTIKVSVGTATGGTSEGTLEESNAEAGSKAKKTYLQNLNKGSAQDATVTDWTWVCEIKFTVENTIDTNTLTLADKEKLVKANEGFFNKLSEKENHKKLKIKFIKDCAEARGIEKNRKINKKVNLTSTDDVITKENEIKTTKTFELRKGDTASGEEDTKLYPVDKSDFDHWFKNEGN